MQDNLGGSLVLALVVGAGLWGVAALGQDKKAPKTQASVAPVVTVPAPLRDRLSEELAALRVEIVRLRESPVRVQCQEIASEVKEWRRVLQSCPKASVDDSGKVTLCGKCLFCALRRLLMK